MLRDYQKDGLKLLKESMINCKRRNVAQNVILAAPCAYGKTRTAAHILKSYQDIGKRGIFICDRVKLVNQSIDAFRDYKLDFSVIQAHHELYDKNKPVQIASAQSLENFKSWPDSDIVIVDETHSLRESIKKQMELWNNVPFIGLSATPYSKGLGKYYNDLVVPIEPVELIKRGYLCPVDYYGGREVNLKGVRVKGDYVGKDLREAIEKDEVLAGDIVKNWLKHANGLMSIAFSPSVPHSKKLVDLFNASGIPAAHIDGYMTDDEKDDLYEAHHNGEFLILSCSRLLNTGYDEPNIQCLIDCYPTKSIIQYVQRAGRIMRTAEGKDRAIYLDHAGNVGEHGFFAEDIVPESLCDGEKKTQERQLTKDKKEQKVKECPQCHKKMVGVRCKCGYEIPIREQLITDGQELEQLVAAEARSWNKKTSKSKKAEFYGMCLGYAQQKGHKQGWAAHKFRERAGVWPNHYKDQNPIPPDADFMNYMKHLAIKRSHANK